MSNCTLRTAPRDAGATLWAGWYVRRRAAVRGSSVLLGTVLGAVMTDLKFVSSGTASKSPHSAVSSWSWTLSYLTVSYPSVTRQVCSGSAWSLTMDHVMAALPGLSPCFKSSCMDHHLSYGMAQWRYNSTKDFDGSKLKHAVNYLFFSNGCPNPLFHPTGEWTLCVPPSHFAIRGVPVIWHQPGQVRDHSDPEARCWDGVRAGDGDWYYQVDSQGPPLVCRETVWCLWKP